MNDTSVLETTVSCISAGADILDLSEYTFNEKIADSLRGIDTIYCKQNS